MDFVILSALEFLDGLLNGILVEVDEAHVLLEVLELLVDPLLLHLEAIVVPQLDGGSLSLNLIDELLVLVVNLLHIANSPNLHRFEKLVTIFDKLFCFLAILVELSNDRLSRFLQNVNTLFFSDEAMSTMINNTVNTYEFHTSVTKMLHQFF